jgi:hypothetical protein
LGTARHIRPSGGAYIMVPAKRTRKMVTAPLVRNESETAGNDS